MKTKQRNGIPLLFQCALWTARKQNANWPAQKEKRGRNRRQQMNVEESIIPLARLPIEGIL